MNSKLEDRLPRREFVKAAVAIGGSSALSACVEWETGTDDAEGPINSPETDDAREFPRGSDDPESLPSQQHAWGSSLVTDPHGNTVNPQQQVFLFLNYAGTGVPSHKERENVERALRTLERAYQHGTGGDSGAFFNEGLLFTLGYSPSYFARFDQSLADAAEVPAPDHVISELDEDATPNHYDSLLVLASDYGQIVLSAEEAMFGDLAVVNGVEVEARLGDVFRKAERRTGFIGRGLSEKLDQEEVPDNAMQAMGFKSGFHDNLATEDRVAIDSGPFTDGTTWHVSKLTLDLDAWYDRSESDRIDLMFAPELDADDAGETGRELGASSRITEELVDQLETDAKRHGKVGHAQKTARARDDEFRPRILRRPESVATDQPTPSFNFSSFQRDISAFIEARQAMAEDEIDEHVQQSHHGIIDFIEVENRANFLVPPRRHRALPTPRPA